MNMRNAIRSVLGRLGLLPAAWRLRARLDPSREAAYQAERKILEGLAERLGTAYAGHIQSMPAGRRVLVSAMSTVNGVALQSPLLAAFTKAGFRPVVLLYEPNPCLMRAYRLFGVDRFVHFGQYVWQSSSNSVLQGVLNELRSGVGFFDIRHQDAFVGKYVLSWYMRTNRCGDPDLDSPEALNSILPELADGLAYAEAAQAIVERIRPSVGLLIDIGYSPAGQMLDQLMVRDIPCYAWNSSHRNGSLMLKRYMPENRHMHPASLSDKTWARLKAMPWDERCLEKVAGELEGCYRSGQWFASVGTQASKIFPEACNLRERFGLDPSRKTAVIFPHIFWDSSFFWGEDLFRNFEHWFKETLKAAAANTSLNWLVKVHPANIVKDLRDGYTGIGSEDAAIREALGVLPEHIKLLPAGSEIATAALFPLMDYCLTVRGTVGIEAAFNGVKTITAGTGRYDRRGFTVDPGSQEEYLDLLARLHGVPPMSAGEIELARRFAYGLFIARPTPLNALTFRFRADAQGTLEIDIPDASAANPAEDQAISDIATWMDGGDEDFIRPGTLP